MRSQKHIFSEQLALLLKLLPLPWVATFLNAAVIVYVFRASAQFESLLNWFWVNIIIILLRFLLYVKFQSDVKKGIELDEVFYWLFFTGTVFSAVTWAYLVLFLFPQNNLIHELFIAFLWAGMASGAISSLSARFEIYAVYATVLLAPLSLHFFFSSGDVSFFMGLTTFVFWLVLLSSSIKLYKTTKSSLELAYENSDLLKEVDKLNAQLTSKLHLAQAEVHHQEALLFQQEKLALMGEMIGNIAHQWRQPLNVLALNIQNVEEAYEFGELDKEYISNMTAKSMSQISYMSKTIDDFRDFVKPNQKLESIDVYQALDEALNLVSQSLKQQKISYVLEEPSDRLGAVGYVGEFKQVIINLINNARDAIVEKGIQEGQIKISLLLEEERVKVFIEDNAGGIADDIINRVFEPYFTTKEEGKGTGIGLYMSHMIIKEKMGGAISVQNGTKGALFTIELPYVQQEDSGAIASKNII